MKKKLIFMMTALTVLVVIIIGLALLIPMISGPFNPSIKCLYNSKVIIFNDKNKDGAKGPDEDPISGVRLIYQGLKKGQTAPTKTISDSNGEVLIAVWSDGCAPLSFDIEIQPDPRFSLTTPGSYHISYSENRMGIGNVKLETFWKGADYYFGLR